MAEPGITQASKARLKHKAEDVFRGLWASLFLSGPSAGKSVLICSADRKEGASTMACGLALAGSEPAGIARVALVDMNVRQPKLAHMLRCNSGPGVGDVVLKGHPAEEAAQAVNAGLDLYTAGDVGDRVLELLKSDALGRFLHTIAEQYDHVVVDCAAANQYADAQVLAGRVGSVMLVARSNATPREAVALAKKRIESGGGKVAGVVLNMRKYPVPKFLYKRV